MADQWDYYRAALKREFRPIMEAKPESGFYRHYIGAPIAIWRDTEDTPYADATMLVDGATVDDVIQRGKTWLSVAKHPVSKKDYDARLETGEWPEPLPEIKKAEPAPASVEATVAEEAPGPGHNSGNADAYQTMRAELLGDVSEAQAHLARNPVKEKADADKASDWADRIASLRKAADKAREDEKAPVWTKLKEIEVKWQDIIKPALAQETALRGAALAWGKAEAARLRKIAEDEAQKAWEAQQAALKRKCEEEAAAQAAAQAAQRAAQPDADGVIEHIQPEPELPLAPPPKPIVPEVKVTVGTGTYGNRRSAKTAEPETAQITDLVAMASFYAAQDHPDLRKLMVTLADRAIKARTPIPGVQFSWQTKQAEKVPA